MNVLPPPPVLPPVECRRALRLVRFPFDRVERLVNPHGDLSDTALARVLGRNPRLIYRWRKNGLDLKRADELAIHLCTHPGLIWPEWWTLPLPDENPSRHPDHAELVDQDKHAA